MIHFSMICARNGRLGIPHERSGSHLDMLLRYDIHPVQCMYRVICMVSYIHLIGAGSIVTLNLN